MIVVCAWCGEKLRNIDYGTAKVSHGICMTCFNKFDLKKDKQSFEKLINKFSNPVVLLDKTGLSICANDSARKRFHINYIDHKMAGDLIQCIHASRENGCGKQVHCKTCTLRNILNETYTNNKCFQNVSFNYHVIEHGRDEYKSITVSSKKIGDNVFIEVQNR